MLELINHDDRTLFFVLLALSSLGLFIIVSILLMFAIFYKKERITITLSSLTLTFFILTITFNILFLTNQISYTGQYQSKPYTIKEVKKESVVLNTNEEVEVFKHKFKEGDKVILTTRPLNLKKHVKQKIKINELKDQVKINQEPIFMLSPLH